MPLSVPRGGGATVGAWALPSTLPSGARTFLPGVPEIEAAAAVTRSAPALQPHSSITIWEGQADGILSEAGPAQPGYAEQKRGRHQFDKFRSVSCRGSVKEQDAAATVTQDGLPAASYLLLLLSG